MAQDLQASAALPNGRKRVMKERKAIKARRVSERDLAQRERMIWTNQLIDTLELCNGVVEEKQLKDTCRWLKIDAAVESGLLVERRNPDGTRSFIRGPNLKPWLLKPE